MKYLWKIDDETKFRNDTVEAETAKHALLQLVDSDYFDQMEEELEEGICSSVVIRVENEEDSSDNSWTEVEIHHPLYLDLCTNCGSEAHYIEDERGKIKVACNKCSMSTCWYENKREVADIWNS